MDILAEQLDQRLHEWRPEVADQVRRYIQEIMESADQGALDLMRSRALEQEVLDMLDDPLSR